MSTQPNDGEDQQLIDAYQFSHNPFAARVPGFKFYPNRRKPVLTQLHQFAQHNPLMSVITGPEGSGKSMMRQALVASSSKQSVISVAVSGKQMPDSAVLLPYFSRMLGGSGQDIDALLGQVVRLAQEGKSVYLLIDDADGLTDEALHSLADLAVGDRDGHACVFLFADTRLSKRLESLGLGDHSHSIPLQAYSLSETREYLQIRIEGAGQKLEDIFSEEQVEFIHEASGGWPGQINQVATQTLLESLDDEDTAPPKAGGGLAALPRQHLIAVGAILAALGGLFAFKGLFNKGAPDKPATETAISTPASNPTNGTVTGNEHTAPLQLNQPFPREPVAHNGQTRPEEWDASRATLPAGVPPQPLPLNAAPPLSAMAPVTPARQTTTPATPVTSPVAPRQTPPVQTPPPPKATAPTPVPPTPTRLTTPTPPPASRPAPAPAPTTTPTPAPAMTAAAGSAGQGGWYLGQPVAQFTLQLLGTSSEATARQYANAGSDYHYFRKIHNGQPLYVVTYGRFSSADAAKAAIRELPANLQAGKPWPRSFASIQQEIRQAGR